MKPAGSLDPFTEPLALRDESHKEEGKYEIKKRAQAKNLDLTISRYISLFKMLRMSEISKNVDENNKREFYNKTFSF